MTNIDTLSLAFVSACLAYSAWTLRTRWPSLQAQWAPWQLMLSKVLVGASGLGWAGASLGALLGAVAAPGAFAAGAALGTLLPYLLLRQRGGAKQQTERMAAPKGAPSVRALARAVSKARLSGDLQLAGVTFAREWEPGHLLLLDAGSTFSSACLATWLPTLRERGDCVVVLDKGGRLLQEHFNPETDFVFNPFDHRSVGWHPLLELQDTADISTLADAMLSSESAHSAHGDARKLLQGLLTLLYKGNQLSLEQLLGWVVHGQGPQMQGLLAGAAVSVASDEARLAEARAVLQRALAGYDHLRGQRAEFSVKDMVQAEHSGCLFVTYTEQHLPLTAHATAVLLDVALRSAHALGPDDQRRVWFLVDRLDALPAVPALAELASQLGPCGVCLAVGVSSLDSWEQKQGAAQLRAVLENVHSVLVLERTKKDPAPQNELLEEALPQGQALVAGLRELEDGAGLLKLPVGLGALWPSELGLRSRPKQVDALRPRNFTAEPVIRIHPPTIQAQAARAEATAAKPNTQPPPMAKPKHLMSASGSGSPLALEGTQRGRLSGYRKYSEDMALPELPEASLALVLPPSEPPAASATQSMPPHRAAETARKDVPTPDEGATEVLAVPGGPHRTIKRTPRSGQEQVEAPAVPGSSSAAESGIPVKQMDAPPSTRSAVKNKSEDVGGQGKKGRKAIGRDDLRDLLR